MKKSANKLGKYMFMTGSEELVPHLPEAQKMTKSNFENLLRKYGSIIVKPDGGGAHVYKVTASGKENYVIHKEKKEQQFTWFNIERKYIAEALLAAENGS